MKTDAEINEAVARVLGTVCDRFNCEGCGDDFFKGDDGLIYGPDPMTDDAGRVCWATSADAFFRDLVPEARTRGWFLGVDDHGDSFGVYFARDRDDPEGRVGSTKTFADREFARAGCFAWLATKTA